MISLLASTCIQLYILGVNLYLAVKSIRTQLPAVTDLFIGHLTYPRLLILTFTVHSSLADLRVHCSVQITSRKKSSSETQMYYSHLILNTLNRFSSIRFQLAKNGENIYRSILHDKTHHRLRRRMIFYNYAIVLNSFFYMMNCY